MKTTIDYTVGMRPWFVEKIKKLTRQWQWGLTLPEEARSDSGEVLLTEAEMAFIDAFGPEEEIPVSFGSPPQRFRVLGSYETLLRSRPKKRG